MSVSAHLIVASYLCQVSQKITYLHIYQLKFCKHFSSLLYACILSLSSYTVFIKEWNYYDFYLVHRINTVISCSIYKTTSTYHFSPDNITTSCRTWHTHTYFQNCIVTHLWLFEFYDPFSIHDTRDKSIRRVCP